MGYYMFKKALFVPNIQTEEIFYDILKTSLAEFSKIVFSGIKNFFYSIETEILWY